jgi:hypothetical protein
MSCQEAWRRFVQAQTAYFLIEGELNKLLTSAVSRPGWLALIESEWHDEVERVTKERNRLYEPYRAAEAAYWQAKKTHRD